MGQTKKAIKQEIKAIYKNVLAELDEGQKRLDDDEKAELREYIECLSEGSCHSFSHIFIKRKIEEILRREGNRPLDKTGDIDKLIDDDHEYASKVSVDADLKWILQKHSFEEVIAELRKLMPEKYAELNLVEVASDGE